MDRTRIYTAILKEHFERNRQMAFVSGPRQVGKTWVCRSLGGAYLNWDNTDDRRVLLKGPAALAEKLGLETLRAQPPFAALHSKVLVFDRRIAWIGSYNLDPRSARERTFVGLAQLSVGIELR